MSSDYSRLPSNTGRFRHRKWYSRKFLSPLTVAVILGGVCSIIVLIFFGVGRRQDEPPSRPPNTGATAPPKSAPAPTGPRTPIEQLFDRQSTTFEQAVSRYVLKNNRQPPRNYDKWYNFAKERQCLIDEYDQIHRDFEPFYQLAKKDPKFFGKMVRRGIELAIKDNIGIRTFDVTNKMVKSTDGHSSSYDGGWMFLLQNISTSLPDMNLVFNHRDEPRVAFDARAPNTVRGALTVNDAAPFRNQPAPTSKFYTDEKHCLVPNAPNGFLTYANDANSFLLYSASADFTTDLYPVLSQTKIYPCFADILFPSEFHYERAGNSPKYAYPDNVFWEDKKSLLYWRGQSTGGWISGDNYRSFPRFKLLDIARNHSSLLDVAITAFYEHFCQASHGCTDNDAARIKTEYSITPHAHNEPREDVYKYKYVFDVDGNSFSGRYLGLLKSGSLVFKSTVWAEYFDGWLEPYVHYVPVRPDMSDLVERVEWARGNDGEARRIQRAGKEFVKRVVTDAQNDCYFLLVLLEWARLQSGRI